MEDLFELLIPILAISIPLVAVTGRVIVQPLVQVLARLAEQPRAGEMDAGSNARLTRLEEELAQTRRLLTRVLEEQEFQRALASGSVGTGSTDPHAHSRV